MTRQIDKFDLQAESEGQAIRQHNKLRLHAKQIHKTYRLDGLVFLTGFRQHDILQHA